MDFIDLKKNGFPNNLKEKIADGMFKRIKLTPVGRSNMWYRIIAIPEKPSIGKLAFSASYKLLSQSTGQPLSLLKYQFRVLSSLDVSLDYTSRSYRVTKKSICEL